MKTVNPNAVAAILKFIVAAAVVVLLCIFVSCSPQRKTNKAIQRVLANREALDKVGAEWKKLNPCVNDTTYLHSRDTLIETQTDTLEVHDTATNVVVKEITKLKTVRIIDTLVKVVQEKRALDSLKAESARKDISIAQLQGKLDEARQLAKTEAGRGDKWFWWFIVSVIVGVVLLIVSHLIRSRIKL